MKIRSKVAWFYSLVTLTFVMVVILIYSFVLSVYINRLFYNYLIEKAYLTAQKNYEEDEVDEQSYNIIKQKYSELLPEAREILLNTENVRQVRDTLDKYISVAQEARLYKELPVTFSYGKQQGAAIYYPDNEGNFIILVFAYNYYGSQIKKHILYLSLLVILVGFLVIYVLSRIYSYRILLPLHRILKELKRIRGNNLNRRIAPRGNKDELDELITTLNEMLDRIDATLKSEKSFISNASHELNNPLTAIQGECEIIFMKERSAGEYQEAIGRIHTESRRVIKMIRQLLFLSRQEHELLQNNMEETDLVAFFYTQCAGNSRFVFFRDEDAHFVVYAHPYLLTVALQNILENALKYSDDKVEINLQREEEKIVLRVKDYGIGIPPEEVDEVFGSFYRASNTRGIQGQGIGLALSRKIIKIYGGDIRIVSQVGEFTEVKVIFG